MAAGESDPATHHRDGFTRHHKLPQIDGNPFHSRQQHMIPVAGIQDQELAVIAEGSRINHPAITRSCDLGTRPGGDGKAFFAGRRAPSDAPIFPDSHAIHRQRQSSLGPGEGDRRGQPARVLRAPPGRAAIRRLFFSPLRAASRAARVVRSSSCSSLAISSCRSSACRASCAARWRSAASVFSTSACCFWRCSVSAVSCAPVVGERGAALFEVGALGRDLLAHRAPAPRDRRASASTSWRISGSTAPSSIAERTDCSASSGVTSSAGGGLPADALQRRQHLAR